MAPEYEDSHPRETDVDQEWRAVKQSAVIFLVGVVLAVALLAAFWFLSRRYRRLGVMALKAFGILLITLFLAEITLRTYHLFRPLYFFYEDSYNRFRGRPFADDWDFRLNSKGFKDVEYSEAKTSACRVLGLGDSFAFGVVPYKFNYLTRLEEILRAEGRDVEIINMGIPRTGPVDYLNLLVREGLCLNPDMVLVSFFAGNDFVERVYREVKRRKWFEYSFVASFAYYLTHVRPHYQGWSAHGAQTYDDNAPAFSEEAFLKAEYQRSVVCQRGNDEFRQGLAAALVELTKMRDVCKYRDIVFMVVIIPDEVQVNASIQREVMAKAGESAGSRTWDWSQPNTALAAELDKAGIAHIDLYPAFREASKQQLLYKPRDSHWNIAGNELAAQVLGKYVAAALSPSVTNGTTGGEHQIGPHEK